MKYTLSKLVYYFWLFYCLYDFCFIRNDSDDNLAMIDVIIVIGCLICLEIRKLKD